MTAQEKDFVEELEIFAMATDPIYIGTGGYTIGRVDNTIVRDPITNVPKIPGSSLAGTWRYYVVLEVHKYFSKDELKTDKYERKKELDVFLGSKGKSSWSDLSKDEKEEFMKQIFSIDGRDGNENKEWILFEGNRFIGIKCAGQDESPDKYFEELDESIENTGHCGHCIVCKGFGFSKKDISWQGMLFFSDLEIIFFPVFTIKGTKWITTQRIIENVKHENGENNSEKEEKLCFVFEKISKDETEGHINLGWLYLPYKLDARDKLKSKILKILKDLPYKLNLEDIIVVPEDLFPHIVNSNLEVRTSVSIDPITGAAKEGALFTSEAIPRGTIFYGNIRIFNKEGFENLEPKLKPLPKLECLKDALDGSKHFYETLGIGGMTTRGFGRLVINLNHNITETCRINENQDDTDSSGGSEDE